MSESTELASGRITKFDRLAVVLHQPTDSPPVVLLRWPAAPSVCDPNPESHSERCGRYGAHPG